MGPVFFCHECEATFDSSLNSASAWQCPFCHSEFVEQTDTGANTDDGEADETGPNVQVRVAFGFGFGRGHANDAGDSSTTTTTTTPSHVNWLWQGDFNALAGQEPTDDRQPDELLGLARQLFQIVTTARRGPTAGNESATASYRDSSTTADTQRPAPNPQSPLLSVLTHLTQTLLRDTRESSPLLSGRMGDYVSDGAALDALLNNLFQQALSADQPVRGLRPEAIAALPRCDPQTLLLRPGVMRECAICQESFAEGGATETAGSVMLLPCDHPFHVECIDPWLRRVASCPICRLMVPEAEGEGRKQ